MTSERPLRFQSPREAEADRPRLDPNARIAIQDYSGIVAMYSFGETERVCCQLVVNSSLCNQEHQNGYVVMRKDGAEGFVGHVCAHKHLKQDESFSRDARQFQRRLDIADLRDRLNALLHDAPQSRIIAAKDRRKSICARIAGIQGALPALVRDKLRVMAKSQQTEVGIEYHYEETDEKSGRRTIRRVRVIVGKLSGIEIFRGHQLIEIADILTAAHRAIDSGPPSPDESPKSMQSRVKAIFALPDGERQLARLEAAVIRFWEPLNLRLLRLTTRNEDAQIAAVRLAMELADELPLSEHRVKAQWLRWDAELREANSGRQFSIP